MCCASEAEIVIVTTKVLKYNELLLLKLVVYGIIQSL